MTNYYTELELTQEATPAEIKAAFKRLALQYHPDRTQGDSVKEEKFKEINRAYRVLSNPFEKAKYDLQLKYGQVYEPADTIYSPPSSKRHTKYEPAVDARENWIATAYAFAFTFIVAVVVMSGIKVNSYLNSLEASATMKERREKFETAKKHYQVGKVNKALEEISTLGSFSESERDMEQYVNQIYQSFIFEGENRFNSGDYQEAIYYYELIEEYSNREPLPLKEHLALAYKNTNQPHKSIQKLKEILVSGYRNIEVYLLLADIYSDMLSEKEEAKRYLEIANEITIKNYKAVYGEAYPLFLSGSKLPKAHFILYTNLAKLYFETGENEKAVKATQWNIHIWPDSASNYVTAAKSYAALGEWKEACESSKKAKKLGYMYNDLISCN